MADKLPLDPDELTPADLLRAKVMLKGRNPYELLNDSEQVLPLTMWCLLSRSNPELTWDEAMHTKFGAFADPAAARSANGQEPPPLATASPAAPGVSGRRGTPKPKTPNGKRRGSAASTASDRASTTP